MCQSRLKHFCFLFVVALSCLVPVWAQDTLSPIANTQENELPQSVSWDSLEELLQMLKSEATLQSEDLTRLSEVLEQSRTEISELHTSLMQLEQQLSNLEQSMKEQAKQYQRMVQNRNLWRTIAISSSVFAVISIVVGVIF